jgi:membrane protein YdbS with pleckstrin-like domain
MYSVLKGTILRLLRAPTDPPEPPAGTHGSVRTFRASPRFLTYRLIVFYLSSAGALIGLLIGSVATGFEGEWTAFLLIALSGLPVVVGLFLGWFSVRIDYDLRYYIVTDRSLRVREGAWTVKEKTITFANVQNMRVVQGPLQRLFKIWDLKVDTAGGGTSKKEKGGGSSHSVNVAGIEDAHEVRDLILSCLKGAPASSGLGDPDDHDDDAHGGSGSLVTPAVLDALRALRATAGALHREARDSTHGG